MSYRVVEQIFSENETLPTVMLANINGNPSVKENLNKMEKIIEIAHQKNVNLLIFPELSISGYIWNPTDHNDVWCLLEDGENHAIKKWLDNVKSSLSEGQGSLEYIIYGNARKKDNLFYNCTYILHPSIDYNQEENIYAKIFLTPIEKKFFRQGIDKRLSIDTKWGRFGFLICYDLCFVELPRQYAYIDEVDAIITISAWRSQAVRDYPLMNTRTDHYYGFLWDLMNSSMSAYNQVWSLGANWVGLHKISRESFWGGSGIWAPSGMKLLQASNINEELLIIRNMDIAGQRTHEKDDFNYRIDFENFYRNLKHKENSTFCFNEE